MSDTRKEVFKNIHERCFQFGSCNYKETGCSDCPINVILVKAETLLDKQEQGLLLELPVAIGTTVFCIDTEYEDMYDVDSEFYIVVEQKFNIGMLDEWGKWVFATEAEAEEALAKMGGK